LKIKFRVVESLYEGLTRAEANVRRTACRCLLDLLSKECGFAKELFPNDEKLKKVMKPVLTCLQQETF
jgi:hypothetical protein